MKPSPVTPTIPLDADGVHHGYLRLPWSRDDSAWGALMTPLTVIANGAGPCALLTGANHGDEYEGPIVLQELAHTLKREQITGRVIVIPFLNYPAFLAGKRTSPVDGGNMNRAFPGRPDGSLTEKIADFVTRTLLPMADIVLDFHSGGKTLQFVPFAACHALADDAHQQACIAAVDAFAAPYSLLMRELDAEGMFDTTAEAMGKTFVTTELAGGGTSTPATVAIARRGLHNVLVHAGILAADPDPAPTPTRWLSQPGDDCFVIAEHSGLIEPVAELESVLCAGDLIARVWSSQRSGDGPIEYRCPGDGMLIARHFPGLVKPGDCIAVTAMADAGTP